MVFFDIEMYHEGYFGHENGVMVYKDGDKTMIGGQDSDFLSVFKAEEKKKNEIPNPLKTFTPFTPLKPILCRALFTNISVPFVATPSSLFFAGKQSPLQPPSVVAAPSNAAPSVAAPSVS
ncbi:hypothetical protein PIB30_058218 [Stylosanthes scabra]|uniref:Uncharacterized protein n=1 Tax=Stylosanthes scabra TaxID=79078 RepID=A0ABU6SLR1_9FABA|nr:hypothetical protein [Stylosanthes scabra]